MWQAETGGNGDDTMEISTSHRIIFMHVQRTGGTSVLSALRELSLWVEPPRTRANRLISRLPIVRSPERIHFRAHDTLPFVQRRLPPAVFEEYLKVAFVRNPYSWLTSTYCTFRRGKNHRHHPIVAAMSGFPEYVDWEIKRNKRHQHIFLLDRTGQVGIDFAGRFEDLPAEYERLCRLIDVDAPPLQHRNQNRFEDYTEFYDEETREKVARHWQRDIELLGYDFDGNRLPSPLDSLPANPG
jgi:hypothetical protein